MKVNEGIMTCESKQMSRSSLGHVVVFHEEVLEMEQKGLNVGLKRGQVAGGPRDTP